MKTVDKNPVQEKLIQLRKSLQITQDEAAGLIGVTSTTLSRWTHQRNIRMDAAHETRLEFLLGLIRDAQEAIRAEGIPWWFKTPHPYLSDLRPLDRLRSSSGTQKVQSLLGAMRWGLPA